MSRNIVLVTVDSLRADHCSFMGYDRETTPTLDAMASDGLVFENAIAPGPTTPESMPATFTGHYPVHRRGDDDLASTREQISAHMNARESLPERLSRRGYTTAAFTPNPWTSRYFDFDQGFDHFVDFMGDDLSSSIWERMLEGRSSTIFTATRLLLSWLQRENVFKPWRSFYDDAVDWAREADEPYFLWVFLLDVHFPYLPVDEFRGQSRWRQYEANLRLYLESQRTPYSSRVERQLVTAYDDAVRDTDAFFHRLQTDLDDPLVVVHGDHGEAFGEHGTYTHQHELYEENVHVPLVVSGGPQGVVTDPVSLRSLPSLVTSLATEELSSPSSAFIEARTDDGETITARGSRAKYIERAVETKNGSESRIESASELYDLATGERESVDNEELEELCRDVVSGKREVTAEEWRLKEATRRVVDES